MGREVRDLQTLSFFLSSEAIERCTDEALPPSDRVAACLPLHSNLVLLHQLLLRFVCSDPPSPNPGVRRSKALCSCRSEEGVALCEALLQLCPESCVLRDALAELHLRGGNGEQAVSMWLHALAECPNNAEVFYHSCRFLMAQVSRIRVCHQVVCLW